MNTPADSNDAQDLDGIWGATLELRTLAGSDGSAAGYVGAFVTVLARCSSAQSYVAMVAEILREEGYEIYSIERLAPLSSGEFKMTADLFGLCEKTKDYPIQWTTFQRFRNAH